ncbi:MAG: hypothetical protein V1845_01995 [bacterium]
MPKSKTKPVLLKKDTYLAFIKNSVGARAFRNSYALVGGKREDILKNGELSCAYFVSCVLKILGLINEAHSTVSGTILDMKKSGWKQIKAPKEGSVVVWKLKETKSGWHEHIGFYIGKGEAISNIDKKRTPDKHKLVVRKYREIKEIWWNKKLGG